MDFFTRSWYHRAMKWIVSNQLSALERHLHSSVDTVVFDVYGTLVRSVSNQAYRQAGALLQQAGYDKRAWYDDALTKDDDFLALFQYHDRQQLCTKHHLELARLLESDLHDLSVFDELEALFRVLAEKNMRWICCSNAARPYQKAWGLIAATASKVNCPIYADPVWSFERGCKKPDTQMFDQCLHMLDSAPQRAWMVGDTFSHDISGAMRAGFAGALHLVRD